MELRETIQSIAEKFFSLMNITVESVEVIPEDEKRRIFQVILKTPDSKLLIGVHGSTLETTTHLLTRLVERTVGKSFLIHLEINDYLQAKDERLFRYVDSKIAVVVRTGEEVELSALSSYERKKVHNYVAEKAIEGLSTKSMGEGEARCLHLVFSWALPKVDFNISEDGVGI